MPEIKLKKRYKAAGDVFNALLAVGFDPETAGAFLNDINDADVAPVVHREWISVKDDTPKDGEKRVQVFLRDDDFTKPIGENKIDTDRFIDGKWVRWGKHVTHWMPLPEPPKGE